MLQVIRREDSPIVNTLTTLKTFKGNRLKQMFLKTFPHAHYSMVPDELSKIAKGMYIDSRTGAKLLEKYSGEFLVG